jgi:hypothetical protein
LVQRWGLAWIAEPQNKPGAGLPRALGNGAVSSRTGKPRSHVIGHNRRPRMAPPSPHTWSAVSMYVFHVTLLRRRARAGPFPLQIPIQRSDATIRDARAMFPHRCIIRVCGFVVPRHASCHPCIAGGAHDFDSVSPWGLMRHKTHHTIPPPHKMAEKKIERGIKNDPLCPTPSPNRRHPPWPRPSSPSFHVRCAQR